MLDDARQRAVGAAALLLATDSDWKGDLAKFLIEEIVPASRHGKLAFFLNFDRVPVGFITWAHLSEETEARLLSTLDSWLHISEWNEGPELWVRWLYLPKPLLREGISVCLSQVFPGDEVVRVMLDRKAARTALEMNRDTVFRWARTVR
jgi:hemolysin-activating ACP:hemolysin acyltransferase